jgi:ligand-binding sensor domain-containing protein
MSGALLHNRGALFPALKSSGLSDDETRRVWAAFRKGVWQMVVLLRIWQEYVTSHLPKGILAHRVMATSAPLPTALSR